MFTPRFFGIASGVASLLAYIPLVIAWRNGWKPHRTTWTLWIFVSGAVGVSLFIKGAYDQAFITIGYCIGSSIISRLSFKRGTGGWEASDRWCVTLAVTGIVTYAFTNDAITLLVANIVADFAAAFPTIKKLVVEPGSESISGWITFFAGAVVGMFSVTDWSFTNSGVSQWIYPCYLTLVIGLITALTIRRPQETTKEVE